MLPSSLLSLCTKVSASSSLPLRPAPSTTSFHRPLGALRSSLLLALSTQPCATSCPPCRSPAHILSH